MDESEVLVQQLMYMSIDRHLQWRIHLIYVHDFIDLLIDVKFLAGIRTAPRSMEMKEDIWKMQPEIMREY
jgi:hypothetical protein